MSTGLDAVIFDLDGTLLDTLDEITWLVNAVLAERGYPTHDRETYRLLVGRGLEYLLERLLDGMDGEEREIGPMADEIRRRYPEAGDRRTRPYEGISGLLRELLEHGVPAAILTNKPHESAEASVHRFFPGYPFRRITAARPGCVPKPSPAEALRIASECFGVTPERVAMIGDTAVDMRTGRAAGMFPIGVLWGFRDREELESAGAAALVEDVSSLSRVLLGEAPDP